MEPINRKVQALVDMLMSRELLLPEMQRKYVWRATQVRDLLDSIYRDYPSGSILIWETENLPIVKAHTFEKTAQGPIGKRLLLLDGQQRITSLATILTGNKIRMKEVINEIANMAFLTKQGNIIKTNEDPASYFPKVYKRYKGEQLFRQQQIPYDMRLLDYENYEEFLDERARRLVKDMNSFLEDLS